MMAAMWGWAPLLPAWLSSSALWFLVVNAVVAAVAVLSRARPPLPLPLPSPRRGSSGVTLTRRASSAVMQRLRSFSIFSFPSAGFNTTTPLQYPDSPTAAVQETEESPRTPATPRPRAPPLPPSPLSSSGRVPAAEADADEADETTGMSMDEAYARALEARRRPERETEEEARRSEVDAKAEEFIRGFEEDLRQQRLNSIFNYTQMLKQRAHGGGGGGGDRRQPDQL